MKKIDNVLNMVMRTLMSVAMFALVLGGFWQIFSRDALHNPSTFTDEFLRYLLIWAGLIGAAYCFYKDKHIALTIGKEHAHGVVKIILNIFIEIVVLAFVIYVYIIGGLKLTTNNMHQKTAVLQISMSIIYACFPVCGVLVILGKILNYIKIFKAWRNKKTGGLR